MLNFAFILIYMVLCVAHYYLLYIYLYKKIMGYGFTE